jgi:hypothetical protein
MSYMFRPQSLSKKFTIKSRRLGRNETYNFVDRIVFAWQPAGWRFNKKTIARMHSRLHYLACHAPTPVRKKWKAAHDIFYKKHFGTDSASVRYLNRWSCHSWM